MEVFYHAFTLIPEYNLRLMDKVLQVEAQTLGLIETFKNKKAPSKS